METFKANLQEFAQKHPNKGFWADLLGVGDFYYELGIQIIEACITSRSSDGGLTELAEIMRRIKTMRGMDTKQQITEDDMIRAIKTLKPLSGGYQVLQIGDKKLVRSIPKELDKDQTTLLLLAQKEGYVTFDMVYRELGWNKERIVAATL
ncbi:hypothetical protein RO3G_07387 [Rhizopus delemar RA 99-880]|uniref:ESCRT-II complex subunit VPS22 n=1 Tax=Rhizopus delemar (strain RA 99-880 / ATCC MYA-4621 / FGSC 9543 / NRRL 43880) TaxID=246409 RepID=I1C2K2_RHIO9|nr:hypothetical protein RO3G_07387 [Rhizopus delemar RA 99-880]|eukprot:EIE82682.1 hypothetical protein RO3G_07387 [Rhizopus delemar RA 99-880]